MIEEVRRNLWILFDVSMEHPMECFYIIGMLVPICVQGELVLHLY